jgi:hypothetical protein
MSWSLRWSEVAERDLLSIDWRIAGNVDAALMRFAATGEGPLRRVEPDDHLRYRLRIRGAEARLFLDARERVVYVVRVFARSS